MKLVKAILKTLGVLILGAFLFVVCAFIGFLVAQAVNDASKSVALFEYVLFLAGIAISFLLSIIIHESGHLIFGLLTGYKFSSFRIGNFMWIKQNGKIKFRRLSISGTGGQCLMIPPQDKNGRVPTVLYNLGGVLMNLVFGIVCILLYIILSSIPVFSLVLLSSAVISLILALSNGIPMAVGGLPNDGMNAYYLSGNKTAALAFRNQLLMNAELAKGARISDMPEEWFRLPEDADMKNVHCASIAVFASNRFMDSMDFASAEAEVNKLLKSNYNIASIHRSLLTCDLVYCRLIKDGDRAEISSLLTISQQKFMQSMKSFPSVLRTEYAIAVIRDKNAEMAENIKQKFDKAAKKYPYPQDAEQEERLMEYAKTVYSEVGKID